MKKIKSDNTTNDIMTLDGNTDARQQFTMKAAAGASQTMTVKFLPTTALGETDDDYEGPEEYDSIDVSDGLSQTFYLPFPMFIAKIKFIPSGVFVWEAKHISAA